MSPMQVMTAPCFGGSSSFHWTALSFILMSDSHNQRIKSFPRNPFVDTSTSRGLCLVRLWSSSHWKSQPPAIPLTGWGPRPAFLSLWEHPHNCERMLAVYHSCLTLIWGVLSSSDQLLHQMPVSSHLFLNVLWMGCLNVSFGGEGSPVSFSDMWKLWRSL